MSGFIESVQSMIVKTIGFVYLQHHLVYPCIGVSLIALSYIVPGRWADWFVCAGLTLTIVFWYGAYSIRKKRNALYRETQERKDRSQNVERG